MHYKNFGIIAAETHFSIIYEQVLYQGQKIIRRHSKKFRGQREKLLARVTCSVIFHPCFESRTKLFLLAHSVEPSNIIPKNTFLEKLIIAQQVQPCNKFWMLIFIFSRASNWSLQRFSQYPDNLLLLSILIQLTVFFVLYLVISICFDVSEKCRVEHLL
jgi:hypothetical protein